MTAGTLIRTARRTGRLTQTALARRARLTQSHISLIEGEQQNPSFETVERALGAAGHSLIAIPTTREDAATIAADLRADLRFGRPRLALRRFLQLNDNLVAEHGAIRFALAITEPEATGSKQWDAAIAGLVEYRLTEERLPTPDWVNAPSRSLDRSWVFGVGRYALPPAAEQVPEAFARRRVLIDEDSLRSA